MRSIIRINDWPIFYKLLLAFLVVGAIALIPVTLINQGQARQGLLKEAQRNLSNTARNTSTTVGDFLTARSNETSLISTSDAVRSFMKKTVSDRSSLGPNDRDQRDTIALLSSRTSSLGADAYLFVAGLNGQVELTSEPDGGIKSGETSDVTKTPYFKAVIQNKAQRFVSDVQLVTFNETTGKVVAYIYFGSPIRDFAGDTIGLAVTRVNLDRIWLIVNRDKEAAGTGSYTMLVDNQGIRIADSRTADGTNFKKYLFSLLYSIPTNSSDPGSRGQLQASGRFPEVFDFGGHQDVIPLVEQRARSDKFDTENVFFDLTLDKQAFAAAYYRLSSGKDWNYYIVVPDTTYAAAANNITTTALIIGGIFLILLILLALLIANALTRPVRRISRVLGRIGIGDFDARVPVNSRDELGRLGESLNAMFDNTLALIQTREEKEELQMQITRLLDEISTVAEGDLTVQAEVTADITGAIADSFNLMIEELRKTVMNIQAATNQTTVFVDQLVANNRQIDVVSDRQANRVMAVTSSVNEMNISIQRVSAAAGDAANVAQEARANARYGGEAVTKTIGSMNRIRGNVQETAKKIKRLGESSQQIGEIVKLIDDIADQTNMLALNAAIQAAMAGEQGKGFSVVTEEVRRLAQRSANATREIAALVKSIQDDTNAAVIAMEESTGEVVEGSKVADEAGKALSAIGQVVDELADLILNISAVSQQQATTSSSIAQSMVEISALTSEATNLRRKSSEVTALVARTADELRNSVAAFKVSGYAPALQAGNIYDHPPMVQDIFTPLPSAIVTHNNNLEISQPIPISNGHSQMPSAPEPKVRASEAEADLSSMLNESDDNLFDTMFEEVTTGRFYSPSQPVERENTKPRPQALG